MVKLGLTIPFSITHPHGRLTEGHLHERRSCNVLRSMDHAEPSVAEVNVPKTLARLRTDDAGLGEG